LLVCLFAFVHSVTNRICVESKTYLWKGWKEKRERKQREEWKEGQLSTAEIQSQFNLQWQAEWIVWYCQNDYFPLLNALLSPSQSWTAFVLNENLMILWQFWKWLLLLLLLLSILFQLPLNKLEF
jgi:hypothetical protein